jgi:membrane-associated phospholipid phosphatase
MVGWLRVVAYLGDIGIVAPIFLGVCGVLWFRGRKQDVIMWATIFCLAAAVIWLLKYHVGPFTLDIGWRMIHAPNLPSGHVGMSIIFYGQAAILLWQEKTRPSKIAGVLAALLLLMISAAMYLLRWHSFLDIAAAIAIGGILLVVLNLWREKTLKPAGAFEAA